MLEAYINYQSLPEGNGNSEVNRKLLWSDETKIELFAD